MVQIFCEPSERADDNTLTLTGENFHHIVQVLRMRVGEELSVCFTGETAEYRYGIERIESDAAFCRLYFVKEADVELPCPVTVLQGLPKADKMETVIQKTIELGASRIVPVACERSVVRLDEKRGEGKRARWQKIAESAAKQSHRALIPEVTAPVSFAEALSMCADADVRLIPWELAGEQGASMEETRSIIKDVRPGQRVTVFIGPEGGFSEDEVRRAREAGFLPITLGRRILRTETAAMTVLSWLVFTLDR
ncbi:MAG: 16S rRNA (uracil(1498)-N(3))-methyltransferase [Lachnospiraceae bacterium]|nr:16S rRNA (uracil(1498)-N(3))-methyltransferase [Lachnospiraceae bacterium]